MAANSAAIAPGLSRPLLGALEKSFYFGIALSAFPDEKVPPVLACLSQSGSPGSRPEISCTSLKIIVD